MGIMRKYPRERVAVDILSISGKLNFESKTNKKINFENKYEKL
jgi:hypothetical protein